MIPHPRTQQFTILLVSLFNFLIPGIEITQIIPFKDSDELKCDVVINDLFNAKTHSALMSGIPIHLVVSVKLLDNNKNQVLRSESEIEVYYDVWDEMFLVQYFNYREQFRSLDSLKNELKRLRRISISPLSQVKGDRYFYISMKIHVYNDRSGSLIDSIDNESSNKKFNLGTIIKFFFGSSEPDDNWYYSEKFRLNELKFY